MRRRDPRVTSVAAGYPGGKGGLGIYHRIINEIPPHDFFVEPFVGGGAIMYNKRPALLDVGVDINSGTIADTTIYLTWAKLYVGDGLDYIRQLAADFKAIKFRRSHDVDGRQKWRGFPDVVARDPAARFSDAAARVVVYCDPPYLFSTRRSQRRRYMWEASDQANQGKDEAWHRRLLKLLNALPCPVLLSGYDSELYRNTLKAPKWRVISYKAPIRGGNVATEFLWCNFPKPHELHDYRYLGTNRRERERIKRKQQRWVAKLKAMPDLERYAILGAIQETR